MSHPLVILYRLQGRAMMRRITRGAKSVKGALLLAFGVVIVALWIAPSVWIAQAQRRTDPAQVLDAAPLLLLAACMLAVITSGGEKAIAFTPAEVDFLFPAPFTRRQMLAYKLGKSMAGILFSATLLSAVLLRHAPAWPQACVACVLAMLFLQLFSMAVTLLAQSAGERAYTRTRKVVLGIVIAAVAFAAFPYLKAGGRAGFFEIARALRGSPAGAVLLAPLSAFGQLFVAEHWWPAGLKYAAIAAAIDGVLVLVVFYLDADYLEAAATRSQALSDRLARVRKGGIAAMGAPGKRARGAIPMLPPWRGAGPIAWRQATAAIRNARGLLFVLLIIAVGVGPILMSSGNADDVPSAVVGVLAWLTVIVASWLRFDFRGDLDQMDYLKSLPLSNWAIAAGQVFTPVVMMTACHWLIIGSVMIATRTAHDKLLVAALLALPVNVVMFTVENTIFLLFPTRAAVSPADFQGYGRQILTLFVKLIVLTIVGGLSALSGLLVHVLTHSWPATIGVVAAVFSGFAVAMLPLVAWAFKRFDVAGDVPA